jgi:hypothetical protein
VHVGKDVKISETLAQPQAVAGLTVIYCPNPGLSVPWAHYLRPEGPELFQNSESVRF